ncbi:nicotinamide-nucleotide amidase [Litoreibacter ascidiaceicola]|uniref:Nicotinamide-nucleotide amidase n=1 Tax=Litoreibacter ascidiaceicola TaxID=1486859 RepID=A0A1M4W6M5_9RHOB|nr:CinA family protein [Litoreibacter ascidiaceicola]SHE76849.1 nicotinamide-nucleotide amidase [Litoreibacter ascidiaceicola]
MADAAQVLQAARAKGWRIATAESCTGGLIAGALTEIAGSSDVVECGFVTYSNAAKQKMLGVTETSLEAHGAVSEQVAREMAEGALRASGVELAVSVTGIAGPGGSEFKPEGMVCFGVATARGVVTETVQFGPLGRAQVRQATVTHALDSLLKAALS